MGIFVGLFTNIRPMGAESFPIQNIDFTLKDFVEFPPECTKHFRLSAQLRLMKSGSGPFVPDICD